MQELQVDGRYGDITDNQLDEVVQNYRNCIRILEKGKCLVIFEANN